MKRIYTVIFCFLCFSANSQSYQEQFFDLPDSLQQYPITIEYDTSSSNIWQRGMPQKAIFNLAATTPNALTTDTLKNYPENNESIFSFTITDNWSFGIYALQWQQKLDIDTLGNDYAKLEFSIDGGNTWENPFDNPNVYNFYGFDANNIGVDDQGDSVFIGTDTNWRNIWICFSNSFIGELRMKYTFHSDSIPSPHEGWMVDNFISDITYIHTVKEIEQVEYVKVSPNPTQDRVHIQVKPENEYQIIEKMSLIDSNGKVLKIWEHIPIKYFIELKEYPKGVYFLDIQTNQQRESIRIVKS